MTKEELDFIGSMNMCDEISNEAYKKIVNHIEETEISDDCVSRIQALSAIRDLYPNAPFIRANWEKWREKNKKYIECEDIIRALPPVTPIRKAPREDITEGEVRINMVELAFSQAKEHAESIEVLTDNHRLIFKAEKRGNENE